MYEQEIIEEVRDLSPDNQKEVRDFAAFLRERSRSAPRRSIRGILAHRNIRLADEDFAEMRREASKNFPRDLGQK